MLHDDQMSLRFLDFDCLDDIDGVVTYDAVATLTKNQLLALAQEVVIVVQWGDETFPNARGPLHEGFDWDCALQVTPALLALLPPEEQAQATECEPEYGPQGQEWHTLTLTLTGGPAFAEAFRERFGL